MEKPYQIHEKLKSYLNLYIRRHTNTIAGEIIKGIESYHKNPCVLDSLETN